MAWFSRLRPAKGDYWILSIPPRTETDSRFRDAFGDATLFDIFVAVVTIVGPAAFTKQIRFCRETDADSAVRRRLPSIWSMSLRRMPEDIGELALVDAPARTNRQAMSHIQGLTDCPCLYWALVHRCGFDHGLSASGRCIRQHEIDHGSLPAWEEISPIDSPVNSSQLCVL